MDKSTTNTPARTATLGTSPQLLYLIAAVALIIFGIAGAAAFMGWIPTSSAEPDKRAAIDRQSSRAPAAKAQCLNCGQIASVKTVVTAGDGSGLGAVGGAVVGGALGNQVGDGKGRDVATVAGVIGGAFAGNAIEKRSKSTTTYDVTVRLDNGSTRVISEANPPSWRNGDRVKITDGVIQSNN